MSDTTPPLPFEGEPVVEALGMHGAAGDAAGDGVDPSEAERTADHGSVAPSADDEPTDAAPALQDSAAAETNGLP